MGFPAYLVTDLGASASSVSVDSESATYPKANANDGEMASVYRADSTSAIDIEWDLGSAKSMNIFAIHGHNFTEANMTATLFGGNSATPTTPLGTFEWRETSMYLRFATQSIQYVRLVVSDTNSDSLQVGETPFGLSIELPRAMRDGGRRGRDRQQLVHETERGVRYVRHQWVREMRDYAFRVDVDDLAAFSTLDKAVEGMETPFTFVPDVDGEEVLYCRKESDYRPMEIPELSVVDWYDYILSLSSEVTGTEVDA